MDAEVPAESINLQFVFQIFFLQRLGGSSWPFAGFPFKCVTHGAPAHLDVTLLMEFPIRRIFAEIFIYSAPEASWVRGFDPVTPLLFNLYQYLEQNAAFGLVPEHATGHRSQVLPGDRVRHPLSSKKILVRLFDTHIDFTYFHTWDLTHVTCVCDMAQSPLIRIWNTTHSYMRHDSFTYETWLIHIWDTTHSYMKHHSFTHETQLIHIWDTTHSHMRHDSFTYKTWIAGWSQAICSPFKKKRSHFRIFHARICHMGWIWFVGFLKNIGLFCRI